VRFTIHETEKSSQRVSTTIVKSRQPNAVIESRIWYRKGSKLENHENALAAHGHTVGSSILLVLTIAVVLAPRGFAQSGAQADAAAKAAAAPVKPRRV